MSVAELTKKAREELSKIRGGTINDQEKADNVLEQSIMFADNVLKRLVAHTLNKEVDELFDTIIDTRGEILINIEDDEHSKNPIPHTKHLMCLDIVPKDYMLDLGIYKDNEKVKDQMVFLLNTVKVLYCPIKDSMKQWAKENDTTFHNVLQIGLNTTLFIDKDSEKRIGIILKPL